MVVKENDDASENDSENDSDDDSNNNNSNNNLLLSNLRRLTDARQMSKSSSREMSAYAKAPPLRWDGG